MSIRLPRILEGDDRVGGLADQLAVRSRRIHKSVSANAVRARLDEPMIEVLQRASRAKRVVRGIENIKKVLKDEERGQRLADKKTGAVRGQRISRVVFLADDATDNFYKTAARLIERHGARVLAIGLEADSRMIGSTFFGEEERASLIMVDHKHFVADVLVALSAQFAN